MRVSAIGPTRWAAAAVALAAAAACGGSRQAKRQASTPVRVAPAGRIDAPVTILASGIVEPTQSVAVTAQVSGTLLDVLFKEGDVVRAGQVLFRIDPRPLQAAVDQARATLARDEAQAEAGRKDDERYAKLADMGYVSRSQADQMHATAKAQAATVAADQAALRSAEVDLGFATIRAPIAGRTGSLLVRRGNNVSPGSTALVVINQISPVLVRFPVLSQDFEPLQRAVETHPVTVHASSTDSLQTNEIGKLDFLDNAIDSLTGTVTGKARFDNPGRRLWPGEMVFLTIDLDVQRGVIAVPTEAIQQGQQGTFVYVVTRDTAKTRAVATGLQLDSLTVITKGLTAGERVVIDGQSRLNPNSRVSIVGPGSDTGAARLGSAGGAGGANAEGGDVVEGRAGRAGAPEQGQGAGGRATEGPATGGRGGAPGGQRGGLNFPPPIVRSPSGNATTTGNGPTTNAPATPAAPNARPATAPVTPTTPTTGGRPPVQTPPRPGRP